MPHGMDGGDGFGGFAQAEPHDGLVGRGRPAGQQRQADEAVAQGALAMRSLADEGAGQLPPA